MMKSLFFHQLFQVLLLLSTTSTIFHAQSLSSSGSSTSSTSSTTLTYRTAKSTDIPQIATLLCETFDDGNTIPSWNILQRKLTMDGYERQMKKRLELCQQGRHALIVAVDDTTMNTNTNNKASRIAGFMELGIMPSPVPIVVNTTWNDVVVEKTIQPEMPFLANLAVDKSYRRQGIGTKLVQLAIKVSTKWCNDSSSNTINKTIEKNTNTNNENDDNDNLSNTESPSMSMKMSTTTTTTTTTITTSPTFAMYLAVEKENSAAVRLYDGLKFRRVLDETEQTWSSKKLQKRLEERKPRLYFERRLEI